MGICSKPKLRTYCLFKNNFIMEDYLYVFNKRHRHALARLRTSAHTLEIERGRWCNKPVDKRLCLFCTHNVTETEQHFLIECKQYSEIRKELFLYVKPFITNFESFDVSTKFRLIMQIEDTKFTQNLARCVYIMFEKRKEAEYELNINV